MQLLLNKKLPDLSFLTLFSQCCILSIKTIIQDTSGRCKCVIYEKILKNKTSFYAVPCYIVKPVTLY